MNAYDAKQKSIDVLRKRYLGVTSEAEQAILKAVNDGKFQVDLHLQTSADSAQYLTTELRKEGYKVIQSSWQGMNESGYRFDINWREAD